MYGPIGRHVPLRQEPPQGISAAVLVPIGTGPEGDRLLLTKRSAHLESHRSQISFPGGKRSVGDPDLIATALREADEEVGLRPHDIEILGVLDDVVTPTGFTITPVVGRYLLPYAYRPNPGEIDRLLTYPLAELLVPDAIALTPAPFGLGHLTPSFTVEGELVWGATARITQQLVGLLSP